MNEIETLLRNACAIDGDKIDALESAIKTELSPVEIPVKHYFSKGVYAREITIPANSVLTGHIHKFENFNILSKGEMSVLTEDGVVTVKAPFSVVSPPGTRRAAYAHTECVWTTIHGTDEVDVDKIEAIFISKSPDDYRLFCSQQLKVEA